MTNQTATIDTALVTGATGMLGSRIAHHLLDGAAVRLLVRPGWQADPRRRATIEALLRRGASAVEADVTDLAALASATAGVDVVVSALQGGPDVIIDGQTRLAEAAVASGVRRFIPSDFAIDLFRAPAGVPQFAVRRQADAAIEATGIEVLHVLSGAFLDQMLDPAQPGLVDVPHRAVRFWGTGTEAFDLTTVEDTAAFTARLATDPSAGPGVYTISGARAGFRDIAAAVEEVTGVRLEPESWGDEDALRKAIDAKGSSWGAVMEWYFLALLTTPPLAALANDRYPDLHRTGLLDHVRAAYGAAEGVRS